MQTQKTKIISIFKNTKTLASILAMVWFALITYAFDWPPVGCNPENCTKPLTQDFTNQRVGIGTDTPASKLEVAGTIHTSSGGVKFPDGTVQTTAWSGDVKQLIQDFVVANGKSISAGDVVSFVNGYVEKNETIYGNEFAFGSEFVFSSVGSNFTLATTLDSKHFVLVYVNGITNYGTATVGTVANSTISYGSEYVFNPANTSYLSVTTLDSNHFVIAYRDSTGYGVAIIGTVANSTISYGSEYVFNSATTYYPSVTALDSSHFVVVYRDDGNNYYWTAIIGTVSGSIISYGSEYVFNSDSTNYNSIKTLDSTHFLVAYSDGGNNSYGTALVGTISGSTISYGSEYVFNSATTYYPSVTILDSTRFVVAYQDNGNSGYGTAIIGSVSSSTISYSSEYVFNSASTIYISASTLDSIHFFVAYRDGTGYGTTVVGTVSDSTISYGSEYVFNPATTDYPSAITLDSTHFVVAYRDNGNSGYGTSIMGESHILSTDSIGIAKESKIAGENCSIIISGISDVHTGLIPWTIYYANGENLTTFNTSYQVGYAISETELLLNTDTASENQYFGDMIFANNFRITEDWESPQGLIFKNQLSRDVLHLDENGALTADELNWKKLKIGNANQETCDSSNYGAIKYENDNFYGCKSSGWVPFTN